MVIELGTKEEEGKSAFSNFFFVRSTPAGRRRGGQNYPPFTDSLFSSYDDQG